MKGINAFPLCWPEGWRRTASHQRKTDQFKQNRHILTVAQAVDRVYHALSVLRVSESSVIVSTNIEPKLGGGPRSGQREPSDPGVAVYWKAGGDAIHKVMACDQYRTVAGNLGALAATLDAMRTIERHGGSVVLDRAFTGFTALPSPNDWRHVMGFECTPAWEIVQDQYRRLAKQRHPDAGGSDRLMAELNAALHDAKRELGLSS